MRVYYNTPRLLISKSKSKQSIEILINLCTPNYTNNFVRSLDAKTLSGVDTQFTREF